MEAETQQEDERSGEARNREMKGNAAWALVIFCHCHHRMCCDVHSPQISDGGFTSSVELPVYHRAI